MPFIPPVLVEIPEIDGCGNCLNSVPENPAGEAANMAICKRCGWTTTRLQRGPGEGDAFMCESSEVV